MGASIMAAECLTAVIKILFKNLDRTGRELSCVCQIRIELCRTQIRITNGSSDSTVSLSHDLLCGISSEELVAELPTGSKLLPPMIGLVRIEILLAKHHVDCNTEAKTIHDKDGLD